MISSKTYQNGGLFRQATLRYWTNLPIHFYLENLPIVFIFYLEKEQAARRLAEERCKELESKAKKVRYPTLLKLPSCVQYPDCMKYRTII